MAREMKSGSLLSMPSASHDVSKGANSYFISHQQFSVNPESNIKH